jgi:hypothetical protein
LPVRDSDALVSGVIMKVKPFLNAHTLAVAAAAVLGLSAGTANALETTFIGYSDGCFAISPATTCAPTNMSSTQIATLGGLTYLNSNFDVTTAGGFVSIGSGPGTPNIDNLGSFSLSTAPFVYNGQHFDLLVTFTAPPGTVPGSGVFTDTLTGTVNANGGGVFIDFNNTPQSFNFGPGNSGQFDFFVNDLSVTAGHSVAVTGTIETVVTPVPEPETYALFMAGLAAVGFMARRRKS